MELPDEDLREHHRGLWQLEAVFRTREFELQFRPGLHRSGHRFHAHIALAFTTLMCVRHLQDRLRRGDRPWAAEALGETPTESRCHVKGCAITGLRFLAPPFMTPKSKRICQACNVRWATHKRALTDLSANPRNRGKSPLLGPVSTGQLLSLKNLHLRAIEVENRLVRHPDEEFHSALLSGSAGY